MFCFSNSISLRVYWYVNKQIHFINCRCVYMMCKIHKIFKLLICKFYGSKFVWKLFGRFYKVLQFFLIRITCFLRPFFEKFPIRFINVFPSLGRIKPKMRTGCRAMWCVSSAHHWVELVSNGPPPNQIRWRGSAKTTTYSCFEERKKDLDRIFSGQSFSLSYEKRYLRRKKRKKHRRRRIKIYQSSKESIPVGRLVFQVLSWRLFTT